MKNRKLIGISSIDLGVEIYRDGNANRSKVVGPDESDYSYCPKCKSSNIEYDINGIEPESICVYRVHKCLSCNTKWEERYDLVRVTISYSGD